MITGTNTVLLCRSQFIWLRNDKVVPMHNVEVVEVQLQLFLTRHYIIQVLN